MRTVPRLRRPLGPLLTTAMVVAAAAAAAATAASPATAAAVVRVGAAAAAAAAAAADGDGGGGGSGGSDGGALSTRAAAGAAAAAAAAADVRGWAATAAAAAAPAMWLPVDGRRPAWWQFSPDAEDGASVDADADDDDDDDGDNGGTDIATTAAATADALSRTGWARRLVVGWPLLPLPTRSPSSPPRSVVWGHHHGDHEYPTMVRQAAAVVPPLAFSSTRSGDALPGCVAANGWCGRLFKLSVGAPSLLAAHLLGVVVALAAVYGSSGHPPLAGGGAAAGSGRVAATRALSAAASGAGLAAAMAATLPAAAATAAAASDGAAATAAAAVHAAAVVGYFGARFAAATVTRWGWGQQHLPTVSRDDGGGGGDSDLDADDGDPYGKVSDVEAGDGGEDSSSPGNLSATSLGVVPLSGMRRGYPDRPPTNGDGGGEVADVPAAAAARLALPGAPPLLGMPATGDGSVSSAPSASEESYPDPSCSPGSPSSSVSAASLIRTASLPINPLSPRGLGRRRCLQSTWELSSEGDSDGSGRVDDPTFATSAAATAAAGSWSGDDVSATIASAAAVATAAVAPEQATQEAAAVSVTEAAAVVAAATVAEADATTSAAAATATAVGRVALVKHASDGHLPPLWAPWVAGPAAGAAAFSSSHPPATATAAAKSPPSRARRPRWRAAGSDADESDEAGLSTDGGGWGIPVGWRGNSKGRSRAEAAAHGSGGSRDGGNRLRGGIPPSGCRRSVVRVVDSEQPSPPLLPRAAGASEGVSMTASGSGPLAAVSSSWERSAEESSDEPGGSFAVIDLGGMGQLAGRPRRTGDGFGGGGGGGRPNHFTSVTSSPALLSRCSSRGGGHGLRGSARRKVSSLSESTSRGGCHGDDSDSDSSSSSSSGCGRSSGSGRGGGGGRSRRVRRSTRRRGGGGAASGFSAPSTLSTSSLIQVLAVRNRLHALTSSRSRRAARKAAAAAVASSRWGGGLVAGSSSGNGGGGGLSHHRGDDSHGGIGNGNGSGDVGGPSAMRRPAHRDRHASERMLQQVAVGVAAEAPSRSLEAVVTGKAEAGAVAGDGVFATHGVTPTSVERGGSSCDPPATAAPAATTAAAAGMAAAAAAATAGQVLLINGGGAGDEVLVLHPPVEANDGAYLVWEGAPLPASVKGEFGGLSPVSPVVGKGAGESFQVAATGGPDAATSSFAVPSAVSALSGDGSHASGGHASGGGTHAADEASTAGLRGVVPVAARGSGAMGDGNAATPSPPPSLPLGAVGVGVPPPLPPLGPSPVGGTRRRHDGFIPTGVRSSPWAWPLSTPSSEEEVAARGSSPDSFPSTGGGRQRRGTSGNACGGDGSGGGGRHPRRGGGRWLSTVDGHGDHRARGNNRHDRWRSPGFVTTVLSPSAVGTAAMTGVAVGVAATAAAAVPALAAAALVAAAGGVALGGHLGRLLSCSGGVGPEGTATEAESAAVAAAAGARAGTGTGWPLLPSASPSVALPPGLSDLDLDDVGVFDVRGLPPGAAADTAAAATAVAAAKMSAVVAAAAAATPATANASAGAAAAPLTPLPHAASVAAATAATATTMAEVAPPLPLSPSPPPSGVVVTATLLAAAAVAPAGVAAGVAGTTAAPSGAAVGAMGGLLAGAWVYLALVSGGGNGGSAKGTAPSSPLYSWSTGRRPTRGAVPHRRRYRFPLTWEANGGDSTDVAAAATVAKGGGEGWWDYPTSAPPLSSPPAAAGVTGWGRPGDAPTAAPPPAARVPPLGLTQPVTTLYAGKGGVTDVAWACVGAAAVTLLATVVSRL
ncbi:hypothetical protein MMPV_002765 [Pyropia vietnamensis]